MKEIRDILDATGLDFVENSDHNFSITLEFNDDRFQNVFVSGKCAVHNDAQLLHIWSVACEDVNKLEPEVLRKCMANSNKLTMGAWELFGNALVFCVKTICTEESNVIRSIIGFVGATTDEFERKYVGSDSL